MYAGGLIGLFQATTGSVNNSYAVGTITCSGNYAGGIAGSASGSVTNSYARVNLTSSGDNAGGLVGVASGPLRNSHASGSVTGRNGVGGLVGGMYYGTVSDCHATADITGEAGVGGLVGWILSGSVTNSQYDIDTVTINGGHHITIGGLFHHQYLDWIAGGRAVLDIADYSETLAPSDGWYAISHVDGLRHLLGFAGDGRYRFKLVSDLDLSSAPGLHIPYLAAHLDGRNHTVSNLELRQNFSFALGLFGYVMEGSVANLRLVNASVAGAASVGGLAGHVPRGSISNCHVHGEVSGFLWVGGLAGSNPGGSVRNCSVRGTVSGSTNGGGLVGDNRGSLENCSASVIVDGTTNVGGLAGRNTGSVDNCHVTGNVTGGWNVGGLVGWNSGSLSMSHATGNVTGDGNVGGLVGDNSGSVERSFATGNVTGRGSVGGLAGRNEQGSVDNCHATGQVTRSSGTVTSFGGFVGWNDGRIRHCFSTGPVHYNGTKDPTDKGFCGHADPGGDYGMTGNFWDTETSGQTGTAGEATGRTTADMMDISTFLGAGWDITRVADLHERDTGHVWNMVDGRTYPFPGWNGPHHTGDPRAPSDDPSVWLVILLVFMLVILLAMLVMLPVGVFHAGRRHSRQDSGEEPRNSRRGEPPPPP